MRTTLTIDDDIARQLEQEMQRSGESFKGTVNRLLRSGLIGGKRPDGKPFVVTPFPICKEPGMNYDKISELLDDLEGPLHR